MTEWAARLPAGLLDAFREAALEATAHVQRRGGPVRLEIVLFKKELDPLEPVHHTISILQKSWQS